MATSRAKQTEAALRESQRRLRAVFSNAPLTLFALDREGVFTLSEGRSLEALGRRPDEVVGLSVFEVYRDVPQVLENVRRALAGEEFNAIVDVAGLSFETWYSPIKGENGEVTGVIGVSTDVTERKRAEEGLVATVSRLVALIEHVQAGILVEDNTRRIAHVNQDFCTMFGLSGPPQALIGEDCAGTAEEVKGLFAEPDRFVRRIDELLHERRRVVTGEELPLVDGRVFERDYIPIFAGEDYRGHLWHYRDVTERKQSEKALRESERKYRAVVDNVKEVVFQTDATGLWTFLNRAWEEITGFSVEESVGESFLNYVHPDDRQLNLELFRSLVEREKDYCRHEIRYLTKDGGFRWIEVWARLTLDEDDTIVGTSGTLNDITKRKQAEEELRSSVSMLRATLEATEEGILAVDDRTFEIMSFNQKFAEMWRIPEPMLAARDDAQMRAFVLDQLEAPEIFVRGIRRLREREGEGSCDILYLKDGRIFERYSQPQRIGEETVGRVLSFRDVTQRKILDERLAHQALHDPLTDLPNRSLFMDRLKHAIAGVMQREEGKVAVLFMDLDNFKLINDSLGHEVGDQLLVAVVKRLRTYLRPRDTLARLGGDEFALLIEDVRDVSEVTRVTERLSKELQAPFALAGREVFVTASIGIAVSSSAQDQPTNLLKNADLAMYRAKGSGKAHYKVFDPIMSTRALERLELGNDLRRALERDEFRVYYQPKVRLDTNLQHSLRFSGSRAIVTYRATEAPQMVGMEALVRWEHPQRGPLAPSEFIPIAEETSLILPIGRWVLEEACRQARAWQKQYPSELPPMMCVNLSSRQFQYPRLTRDVARILRETGLDPCCLCLEITESVVMEDAQSTITTLGELKDLGVQLAVDDFGTGYSSLAYLKRFPIDYLKIDRSFIEALRENPEDTAIVSGVTTLAHALGMRVIAEGVETAEQLARLRGLGCDLAQGNYFSKPLPSEAASELLANGLH